MPKINVYLPDDLATAVREAGIPVSAVCQRALADAVAAADGLAPATEGKEHQSGGDRLLSRVTHRAQHAIEVAVTAAGGERRSATSIQLVEGLLSEGNNLALAVLRSLDIEPEDLRAELNANRRSGGHAATLDEVCHRAVEEALLLANNYLGCEHLLLGLLAGPDGDPATATLHTLGVTLDKGRNAVRSALMGISYAQGNLSLSGLSAPIRSVLEEIRQRLGRLEQPGN
jgi:ATP-dependent Clp protease ATP-binding subunit ClpA